MFSEVDVSSWVNVGEEQLGAKTKQWLRDEETGQLWLFKYQGTHTHGRAGSAVDVPKGDDWSEVVVAEIAVRLGIPAAHYELAYWDSAGERTLGVICESVVTKREQLIHGFELLAEDGVSAASERDRTGYTVGRSMGVLGNVLPADGCDWSASDTFAAFLVLDAIVGNTDRHQVNWAVIGPVGTSEAERRLAPSFDHASCLGFLLTDSRRLEQLEGRSSSRTMRSYSEGAISCFEGSPPVMEAALSAFGSAAPSVQRALMQRLSLLDSEETVRKVPEHRMSEASREFAIALIRTNIDRFMSQVGG